MWQFDEFRMARRICHVFARQQHVSFCFQWVDGEHKRGFNRGEFALIRIPLLPSRFTAGGGYANDPHNFLHLSVSSPSFSVVQAHSRLSSAGLTVLIWRRRGGRLQIRRFIMGSIM